MKPCLHITICNPPYILHLQKLFIWAIALFWSAQAFLQNFSTLLMVTSVLLLIIVIFHANPRKLRKRDASKFHTQLCIAIFCMLLFFLVGIDRIENDIVCTAMSLTIQYFTLAAVFWMGAEAVLMFQKLIIVFGRITTKYIVIVSLICWCKLGLLTSA